MNEITEIKKKFKKPVEPIVISLGDHLLSLTEFFNRIAKYGFKMNAHFSHNLEIYGPNGGKIAEFDSVTHDITIYDPEVFNPKKLFGEAKAKLVEYDG